MKTFLPILLVFSAAAVFGEKVPKEISLGLAGEYTQVEDFDRSNLGWGLSIRYGWQVGGLGTNYPHFLDIPMMLSFVPSNSPETPDSFLMRYGWSTRHYLTPIDAFAFYLSYGLFLNQVWEWDKPGRILGHETLLSAGFDLPLGGSFRWYLQCNGRYASFGILGDEEGMKYFGGELVSGIRFGW